VSFARGRKTPSRYRPFYDLFAYPATGEDRPRIVYYTGPGDASSESGISVSHEAGKELTEKMSRFPPGLAFHQKQQKSAKW
jgi:hypothetical protein